MAASVGAKWLRLIALVARSRGRAGKLSCHRILRSATRHVDRPRVRTSLGSCELTSMTFTALPVARITSATTASFSMGFSEQVEYTIRPPTCDTDRAHGQLPHGHAMWIAKGDKQGHTLRRFTACRASDSWVP